MQRRPGFLNVAVFGYAFVFAAATCVQFESAWAAEFARSATANKKAVGSSISRAGSSAKVNASEPIAAGKVTVENKIAQARAILKEVQNIEHPEEKIAIGSTGWQEERRAATASSQAMIKSAEGRLTALGSVIAPVLADSLNSTNRDVGQVCTNVLGQMGAPAVASLMVSVEKYGAIPNVVAALRVIGSDSLVPLVEMLESDDQPRSLTALSILNDLTVSGNIRSLRRRNRIGFYSQANNSGTGALVLSGSAIQQICNLDLKNRSLKFKDQLADLLGKIGPRNELVSVRLIALATSEDQPEVREAAICGLGNVAALQRQEAAQKSLAVLLNSLSKDDYSGCRAEAASALGRLSFATDRTVPALADALKDGYPEVVSAAVQSLSALGEKSSAAIPALIKLAQDPIDRSSGYQALNTIGNMHGAAAPAMPFLCQCLQGNDVQLRVAAISAVSNIGAAGAPSVVALIPLLSNPDLQIRLSVIRALGSIGQEARAAAPALREICQRKQQDRNNERQQATQALQKITGETPEEQGTSGGASGDMSHPPSAPSAINFRSSV